MAPSFPSMDDVSYFSIIDSVNLVKVRDALVDGCQRVPRRCERIAPICALIYSAGRKFGELFADWDLLASGVNLRQVTTQPVFETQASLFREMFGPLG